MSRSYPLYYRPLRSRIYNSVGRLIERFGISPATKSDATLKEAAMRLADADDWGEDLAFFEALNMLLGSYREDGNLNWTGWRGVRCMVVRHLVNRLMIQKTITEHPDILEQPVVRPIFVLGLPRSGTTLLQRLLARDPANRALLFWEAVEPLPPPEAATRDTDPRIARAERAIRGIYRMIPDYGMLHPMDARNPEECSILFMNSFMSNFFGLYGRAKSYSAWAAKQDYVPVYRYYRRQLQVLQYRYPRERWMLKAPMHMGHLDALLTVFPDACIVQNHRNPAGAIPSMCSLIAKWRTAHSDSANLNDIGSDCLKGFSRRTRFAAGVREKAADPAQFYDVRFKPFVRDPVETVRGIYAHFGLAFTDAFEQRMRTWLADNPKDKHGKHRYALEQFGLTKEAVEEAFEGYCERYGLE